MSRQALNTPPASEPHRALSTVDFETTDTESFKTLAEKVNDNFTELYLGVGAQPVAGSALTALAGGAQAGTAIGVGLNRFATVATALDSGQLPAATAGKICFVANAAANAMKVFPQTGELIEPWAANAGYVLAGYASALFACEVAGKWTVIGYTHPVNDSEAYNTNSATTDATLTGANISGGDAAVVLNMTGALGAGGNAQLPTVANLVSAMVNNPVAGASYRLRVINSSSGAFDWTVTTNTGWTLAGTMTIAQNTWREFIVTLTSLTAATLQSVGTGTYS